MTDFMDEVWDAALEKFRIEVLKNDAHMIAVPNLSQANFFDSYGVFIKENTGPIASVVEYSSYNVIGHISQVIDLKKTNRDLLLANSKPREDENISMKKWECEITLDGQSVHLTIESMKKTTVPFLFAEGDLTIKKGIPGLDFETGQTKSIYIITDVIKADAITAVATNDNDVWEKISIASRPVAFGYMKFALREDGVVSHLEETHPAQLCTWEVIIDSIAKYLNKLP